MITLQHPTHPGDIAHLSVTWIEEFRMDNGRIVKNRHVTTYHLTRGQDTAENINRILEHNAGRMLHPRVWADGTRSNKILEYGLQAVAWLGSFDAPAPRTTDSYGTPIGVYTQQQADEYTAINRWAFGG